MYINTLFLTPASTLSSYDSVQRTPPAAAKPSPMQQPVAPPSKVSVSPQGQFMSVAEKIFTRLNTAQFDGVDPTTSIAQLANLTEGLSEAEKQDLQGLVQTPEEAEKLANRLKAAVAMGSPDPEGMLHELTRMAHRAANPAPTYQRNGSLA